MAQKNLRRNPKTIAKYSKDFYAHHYLGLQVPDHQHNWYEWLGKYPQSLLLSPRDHGKTTALPRVIAEHITLYNPGANVLLLSKTFDQAYKSLKLIKTDLEENERIRHDFQNELADYYPVKNVLQYNRGDVKKRDPTIEANGLEGALTGSHYNYILMDDIIDDKSVLTAQSRRKTKEWIEGMVLPLLEPGGCIIAIGTRKHYADFYSELIKNPSWHIIQEKMIIKEPESYNYVYKEINGKRTIIDVEVQGEWETLWPSKWGIKEALMKKASMTSPVMFEREYQNNPQGMKGKIFKDIWLEGNQYAIQSDNAEYYGVPKKLPLSSFNGGLYQGVDLAISKKDSADYFVITTMGVRKPDEKHPNIKFEIHVLDWFRDKLDFNEQLQAVKYNYHKWGKGFKPRKIGIESVSYQLALSQAAKQMTILPIDEIQSRTNKTDRIMSGSIHYANNYIKIPVDHPNYPHFLDEYTTFDGGEHDDILDSMDMCIKLIIEEEEEQEVDVVFDAAILPFF